MTHSLARGHLMPDVVQEQGVDLQSEQSKGWAVFDKICRDPDKAGHPGCEGAGAVRAADAEETTKLGQGPTKPKKRRP